MWLVVSDIGPHDLNRRGLGKGSYLFKGLNQQRDLYDVRELGSQSSMPMMSGELHVQEEHPLHPKGWGRIMAAVPDGAPSCVMHLKHTFWAGAENGVGFGRGLGHTSALSGGRWGM